MNGCFVIYNQNDNEYIKYNSEPGASEDIPASTIKITNSLIALEERVGNETNQIIEWDEMVKPQKQWNQDQNLKQQFNIPHLGFYQYCRAIWHKYQDNIDTINSERPASAILVGRTISPKCKPAN
ncbi:penicillin-binding transpeptidase domain-containing protein [Thermophagus sp. OGC60D27]|uniref:penicillin-binding transpeptidase domain-containing protein n=1 Tax=Thermophagus sp. OGC60D27 TaxID=3458415 RepID=UPI0040376BC0